MRRLLVAALLLTGAAASPSKLQVATVRGSYPIALVQRPGDGPLVPLEELARAMNGSVEADGDWAVLVSAAGRFRFLPGAALVEATGTLRPLPATVIRRGAEILVPLAFVAEVLADSGRYAWVWTPASATITEVAAPPPLVVRPSRTTVGQEERGRLPDGLRPGHHVTIDAGHGGPDAGNTGRGLPRGTYEKHITLAVSKKVRDELVRRGVRVTMTRTTDTLINLAHRAPRYCVRDCDLFVSVHVNSLEPRGNYRNVRGFETYMLAEAKTAEAARVAQMENEAVRFEQPDEGAKHLQGLDFILKDLQNSENAHESARAAELVQSRLREVHDGPDRGVKQANFAVLRTARTPAILVELGYGTNDDDARLMTTPHGQLGLATAIADAIVDWLRQYDRKTGDDRRAGTGR